jgi:hypothetical protein
MATQQTWKVVTPIQSQDRLVWPVADPDLLKPSNANPLVMGELLQRDSAGKLVRATDDTKFSWLLIDSAGRADAQAISSVAVVGIDAMLMDTLVFDNAAAPALGAILMQATVTNAAASLTNKSGFKTHAAGGEQVMGHVIEIAANNGGYLRVLMSRA